MKRKKTGEDTALWGCYRQSRRRGDEHRQIQTLYFLEKLEVRFFLASIFLGSLVCCFFQLLFLGFMVKIKASSLQLCLFHVQVHPFRADGLRLKRTRCFCSLPFIVKRERWECPIDEENINPQVCVHLISSHFHSWFFCSSPVHSSPKSFYFTNACSVLTSPFDFMLVVLGGWFFFIPLWCIKSSRSDEMNRICLLTFTQFKLKDSSSFAASGSQLFSRSWKTPWALFLKEATELFHLFQAQFYWFNLCRWLIRWSYSWLGSWG